MPKNKITDLRNHLFEAIEMLKEGDLDVEKAKAIKGLGDTIVNSAKVELHFLKTANDKHINSDFIPEEKLLNSAQGLDEMPDCPCGEEIFPNAYERSNRIGLEKPKCQKCLDALPKIKVA